MDVHDRVHELKKLSWGELLSLPAQGPEEKVKIGQRTFTMIVWHDDLGNGEHRIVVAQYDKFVGTVVADGFVVSSKGMRALTREELLPFV